MGRTLFLRWHCLPLISCVLFANSACFATSLNFSGQLTCIDTDTGGGRYSGVAPGTVFTGTITYGTQADATTDPNFPGDYDFSNPPFGGFITDGAIQTTATDSVQVSVDDDYTVDAPTAALINCALGTSLSSGEVIDISDIDTQETFVSPAGEIVFGVSFINFDSNTYSGRDFTNFAGVSGIYDRALFFVSELDSGGNPVFDGLGDISALSFDPPLPAAYSFSVDSFGVLGNLPGNVSDDFDDGSLAPLWELYEPTVIESGSTANFSKPGGVTPPYKFGALELVSEMSYIGSQSPGSLQMRNGSGDFSGASEWLANLPGQNQFFVMGVGNLDAGEDVSIAVYNFETALANEFGIAPGLGIFFGRFTDVETGDFEVQAVTINPGDVTGNIILRVDFTDVTDTYAGTYSLNGGTSFVTPFAAITTGPGTQELVWYMGAESMVVSSALACDLNGNGIVDAGDLTQVISMALGIIADDLDCDIDHSGTGDGSIDTTDVLAVSRIVLEIDPPVYH